jgi:hypothetical protein
MRLFAPPTCAAKWWRVLLWASTDPNFTHVQWLRNCPLVVFKARWRFGAVAGPHQIKNPLAWVILPLLQFLNDCTSCDGVSLSGLLKPSLFKLPLVHKTASGRTFVSLQGSTFSVLSDYVNGLADFLYAETTFACWVLSILVYTAQRSWTTMSLAYQAAT